MDKSYTKLLAHCKRIDPRETLEGDIYSVITRLELKRVRIRAILYGASSVGALIGTLLIGAYVHQSLLGSGFYEYMSLAFSGDFLVFTLWKQFFLVLVDSIPMLGFALFSIGIISFIWTGLQTALYTQKSAALTYA